MTEESNKRVDPLKGYGQQGNEGQYGQGQYTAEGKPDPRGPQGQEIQSDLPETENNDGQQINQDAYSRQNDLEQERIQQQYALKKQSETPLNAPSSAHLIESHANQHLQKQPEQNKQA